MLEACKVQQYPFTAQQDIVDLDWQLFLRETASQILTEQTPAKLEKVRDRLYELLAQGVPSDVIFQGLVKELVQNCDMSIKAKTIEYAALKSKRIEYPLLGYPTTTVVV
ncbi:Replication factor C subunit 3, partial [Eumeta japonica]